MRNIKKVQTAQLTALVLASCATIPSLAASNGLCGPDSCTLIADLTGGSAVELFYRPDDPVIKPWTNGLTVISGLGGPGWQPIVGDYNNDGLDDLAVYKDGEFSVHWNSGGVFVADDITTYTVPASQGWGANTIPMSGNWDGVNGDDLGMYTDGTFKLFPDSSNLASAITISFGTLPQIPGFVFTQMPFSGPIDADPSGIDRVGIYFGNYAQYAPQTVDATFDFFDLQNSQAVMGMAVRPNTFARPHILEAHNLTPQFSFVMPPDMPEIDPAVCTGGNYVCLNVFPDRPDAEQPVVIPPDPFQ